MVWWNSLQYDEDTDLEKTTKNEIEMDHLGPFFLCYDI